MLTEFCVCGTNLAETEQEARQYQGKFVESNFYHYEFLGEHFRTVKGYDAYQQKAEIARKGGIEGAVNGFMQAASWGTPDKILRGLEARRALLGDYELNVAFRFGGTPLEVSERGLRLFAKEVLPVLKSWGSGRRRESGRLSNGSRDESDMADEEWGLAGKVAIVTGGGAKDDGIGNGRAAAILLARAGAHVLVVDRDLALAERTVAMIAGEGGSAAAASYDVTVSGAMRRDGGGRGVPLGPARLPRQQRRHRQQGHRRRGNRGELGARDARERGQHVPDLQARHSGDDPHRRRRIDRQRVLDLRAAPARADGLYAFRKAR